MPISASYLALKEPKKKLTKQTKQIQITKQTKPYFEAACCLKLFNDPVWSTLDPLVVPHNPLMHPLLPYFLGGFSIKSYGS